MLLLLSSMSEGSGNSNLCSREEQMGTQQPSLELEREASKLTQSFSWWYENPEESSYEVN